MTNTKKCNTQHTCTGYDHVGHTYTHTYVTLSHPDFVVTWSFRKSMSSEMFRFYQNCGEMVLFAPL